MPDIYGVNYTEAYVNTPSGKALPGQQGGDVKLMMDKVTLPRNVMAIGEKFYVGKLPAGAIPVAAFLHSPSQGTTGIMKFGTAADEDGIVASADAGGAAIHAPGNGELLGNKLASETEYYVEWTEASDAGLDVVVTAGIMYVMGY